MLKKLLILLSLLLVTIALPAYAADKYGSYDVPVDIEVNGTFIRCEKKPFIENGSTYIPLRAFAEAVGAEILWDEGTKTATMKKADHTFEFCFTDGACRVDGAVKDYKALISNNLTFVPVRAVSETLGYAVEWDSYYLVVKINAPGVTVPESAKDYAYSYDDILNLAKITMLEAGTGSTDVKIGICNTILNRVKSGSFPNTIHGVIFDTKYGTQFPPVHTDKYNQTPSRGCVVAAKCALNGVSLVGDSLYFIGVKAAPNSWAHKNRKYYTTIENTAFYL